MEIIDNEQRLLKGYLKKLNQYGLVSRVLMFYFWAISFVMYITTQSIGNLTTAENRRYILALCLWFGSVLFTLRFPRVFMTILTLACIGFIGYDLRKPRPLYLEPPRDYVPFRNYFIDILSVFVLIWMVIATIAAFKAERLKRRLLLP